MELSPFALISLELLSSVLPTFQHFQEDSFTNFSNSLSTKEKRSQPIKTAGNFYKQFYFKVNFLLKCACGKGHGIMSPTWGVTVK